MINWYENITVEIREGGVLKDTTHFHNKITDVGLNWFADCLRSSTRTIKILYMGYGSSNLAATSTSTTLSSETGRKIITSASSGTVGQCITICYLAPGEGTGSITEIGWFAGTSATATLNSGRLMSRTTAYSHTKTALESLTVTRTDTFST